MSHFVLVPGAGGAAWYWHRVVPLLRSRGHVAIAVDLPGDDPTKGLPEYATIIAEAFGDKGDAVVVAQSMAGFSAPMACARRQASHLVFLNAMIPLPGETPGEWWAHTGAEQARVEAAKVGGYPADFDLNVYFLHDVPAEVLAEGDAPRNESEVAFTQPCDITELPRLPVSVLAGKDDRFFPLDFQRRVAADRLGCDVDVVPGGHLAALSRPVELAERLERFAS